MQSSYAVQLKMCRLFVILLSVSGGMAAGQLMFGRRLAGCTLLTQTGVSLAGCRSECSARSDCESINFSRMSHTCELNQRAEGADVLDVAPGYIYSERRDWDTSPTCTCSSLERCQPDGTCVTDHCPTLETPTNTVTLGNMNSVGTKTILKWRSNVTTPPYVPSPIRLLCSNDGSWTEERDHLEGTCLKLFRGDSQVSGDFLEIWNTGVHASDDLPCFDHGVCPDLHYRSRTIDNWERIGMRTLRFSVYKDGAEAQYITFDGTGSTLNDWFSHPRVLESSWTSLLSLSSWIFSMSGWNNDKIVRHFYILRKHNWCPGDTIWFSASMRLGNTGGCTWDKAFLPEPPTSTVLVFSRTTEPVKPFSASEEEVAFADFIEVAACF